MFNFVPTIVLVLRSGGDFSFRDVELLSRHIKGKWQSEQRPRIICLYDKASSAYNLGELQILPFNPGVLGTWSRIHLYSPEMEQYKPFLYVDLDTAIIKSVENIFNLVQDPSKFITLEDFWQRGQLATGLVWFPADCKITQQVWKNWKPEHATGSRMDNYLRRQGVRADLYWQQITDTVYDFKPIDKKLLNYIPGNANLICFHGKPRIFQVAEGSLTIKWVQDYVEQDSFVLPKKNKRVTVIIPYKEDRGWLKDAVASVPEDVQLLLAKGDGNWPKNFNDALPHAEGEFIKYLHEDDMLTENCIRDSIATFEQTGADFIHGDAIELSMSTNKEIIWRSPNKTVTFDSLFAKNTIHSASLMYRKTIFEQIGGFDESLDNQEEYEFNLRCLHSGFKLAYCNSPLAIYRRHPQQKVRNITKEERDREKALVKSKFVK
jgi:hypothetical protein